jgi:hypothetical protein
MIHPAIALAIPPKNSNAASFNPFGIEPGRWSSAITPATPAPLNATSARTASSSLVSALLLKSSSLIAGAIPINTP